MLLQNPLHTWLRNTIFASRTDRKHYPEAYFQTLFLTDTKKNPFSYHWAQCVIKNDYKYKSNLHPGLLLFTSFDGIYSMTNNTRLGISKSHAPEIIGVLDYRGFYGKVAPDDTVVKLIKYPTDTLIIMLAKLNALVFNNSRHPALIDNSCFLYVFNRLSKSKYNQLLKIRSTKEGQYAAVYTAPTIVALMAKLIAKYKPINDDTPISPEIEQIMQEELFDAILAINDAYYNRVDESNMMTHEHIWKLELFQQRFARNTDNLAGVSPFKVFLFFRFMSERYGEGILKEFADAFQVTTAYDFYFVFLQTIVSSIFSYEQDGNPRFCIVNETFERVVKPFTYNPAEPQSIPHSGESFAIINQPFYRLENGLAVLDFSFFSQIIDVSLMYYFYHVTSLKEKYSISNYNAYLSVVGKDFYEKYIALELIKKQFSHIHDKILSEKDDPMYPDILIIQNNKDVFVIEVKSARVHGKVLDQTDIAAFQKFLQDSFATEKQNAREKNKGIYQLKNQIQHLKSKGRKLRIFPVIVYTDPSLDIAGVNTCLDDKFESIIAEEKSFFLKIHPLTLINLNFFIKYYLNLKEQRYFLRDKIIAYQKQRKIQLKKASKKKNPWIFLTGEFSFMRYMEHTCQVQEPMTYFKAAATDFGFGEHTEAANNPLYPQNP